jgi:uncharacterized membrane protein YgaE (UPF0421/DUF939 family)
MIKVKIGARTIKTALALLLALIIPSHIGLGDSTGLAAAAVILSMKPSVAETFETTRDRLLSNIIGGVIAYLFAYFLGSNVVMISAAAALLIAVLHQLNLNNVIGLSTLTLVNVMLSPDSDLLLNAVVRVSATLVGILIAFVVNTFVLPPKYDVRFYENTVALTDNSMKYVRSMLRKNSQFPLMKEDLRALNKQLSTLKKLHKYMKDPFFNRFASSKYYSLLRFLVVCRQSIKANEVLYELADALHDSENTINHLPLELRTLMRERMETLMTAHEQILLKWNGRVLPEEVNFIAYRTDLRRGFMEAFYVEASSDEAMEYDFSKGNDLLRIMTKIFEYDKKLQHFNSLTNSFVRSQRYDLIEHEYDN